VHDLHVIGKEPNTRVQPLQDHYVPSVCAQSQIPIHSELMSKLKMHRLLPPAPSPSSLARTKDILKGLSAAPKYLPQRLTSERAQDTMSFVQSSIS
jgi:hypothetical protein